MNSIVMRILGHPKPEPRTKAVIRGLHAGIYRPGTAVAWEKCVTLEAEKFRPVQMIEGPVRVDIIVIVARPKAHESSKGGLKKSAPAYYNVAGRGPYGGDFDNYAKLICDTLTDCAFWKDDGQVQGSCRKRWADLGEPQGALVVVTPVEDREPGGWLTDIDHRMKKLDAAAPGPKTQQVIPSVAPAPKPNPLRQFTDLWVAKWMNKHMTRYPFAGAKDALCATRIWDACGHDLAFAAKVIDSFLADDQEFYKGHTLQMLSAAGVLPKFLAGARPAAVQRDLTIKELYAKRGPGQ